MPRVKNKEEQLEKERNRLLIRIQQWFEIPLIILGIVWLILTFIDLTKGLNPLQTKANDIIWAIFIVDFLLRFMIAPRKLKFLKSNIITAVSLFVPAVRILRIAQITRTIRVLRLTGSFKLVRVIGSINRGMSTLGKTMERRAFGFVLVLTLIVWLIGAAGMFAFEKSETGGIESYGYALWWTSMLLTSIGPEYWPRTAEGRVLCIFIGMYGFAVLGYFTALLASYFLGQDAESKDSDIVSATQIKELKRQLIKLREELKEHRKQ